MNAIRRLVFVGVAWTWVAANGMNTVVQAGECEDSCEWTCAQELNDCHEDVLQEQVECQYGCDQSFPDHNDPGYEACMESCDRSAEYEACTDAYSLCVQTCVGNCAPSNCDDYYQCFDNDDCEYVWCGWSPPGSAFCGEGGHCCCP